MGLGTEIRRARKEHGWTVRELAQALETSESYIAKLERDAITPGADRVLKIANVLDVTPNDLLKNESTEVAS